MKTRKFISFIILFLVGFSLSITTVSCIYDISAKSDVGIFNYEDYRDGSFQQNSFDGIAAVEGADNVNWIMTSDNSTTSHFKAYKAFIANGGNYLITPAAGFEALVKKSAKIWPDQKFIILDEPLTGTDSYPNVTALDFEIQKAAFVVGYMLGMYGNDPENSERFGNQDEIRVGGWGGGDYPSVNKYLSGLRQGMTYYNKTVYNENKDEIKPLVFKLFSTTDKGANYSNGFTPGANNAKDQAIAKVLIEKEKVDFILPVAASQTQTAVTVSAANNSRTFVIGVDSDQRIIYQQYADLFITSITKNNAGMIEDSLRAAKYDPVTWESTYSSKTHKGNVKNEGVGYIKDGLLEKYIVPNDVIEASEFAEEPNSENDWTNNNAKAWQY